MTKTEQRKKRKFGPQPKPLKELKLKIVPVRYSSGGLAKLDQLRGQIPRAVWCHDASLQQPPAPPAPQFPEVNRQVWGELAQGPMSTMNQIMAEAHLLQKKYPQEDMKWRVLSEKYDELIDIAHRLRDGLLTVISTPREGSN